jgi:hypothetical protein
MGETTGPQLLLVAYNGLSLEEQDEAFALIRGARLSRQAEGESDMARMTRSLRRAAEHCNAGSELTVDEYRQAVRDLKATEDPLVPLSRVLDFFDGSWRQAREACLVLSDGETSRSLSERLRRRKLGKVWRWKPETLEKVLQEACRDHGDDSSDERGRPILVAEFDWWRQQRIDLATAQGDDNFHLPSRAAYRRLFRTWEQTLVGCCGFTEQEVKTRFQSTSTRGG